MSAQKPLELILARNLLSSISTPAFLVGGEGTLLFYNEAAGVLVGRRFEESGTMSAQEWTTAFGPFGADDQPMPYDEIPMTQALRSGRPSHGKFRICAASRRLSVRLRPSASGGPVSGCSARSASLRQARSAAYLCQSF